MIKFAELCNSWLNKFVHFLSFSSPVEFKLVLFPSNIIYTFSILNGVVIIDSNTSSSSCVLCSSSLSSFRKSSIFIILSLPSSNSSSDFSNSRLWTIIFRPFYWINFVISVFISEMEKSILTSPKGRVIPCLSWSAFKFWFNSVSFSSFLD